MNFRKLLTYLAVGTAAVIPFAGAQNPTILQGNYISNVFGQSNFILNPNAQTNVANVTVSSATVTRSTTTPLVATSEFNITTSTATGYADWATRTFDAGMKNQNCEARFTYRGFSVGSTTVQIRQSSNTVAQLTLTPSTDPRIASINFPCGDLSSATTLRVQQATASLTGTNEIGGIYLGLATNQANVAQAETVVIAGRNVVQPIPTGVTTTIEFNVETKDTYGEYNNSNGVFTAKRAGTYYVSAMSLTGLYTWTSGMTHELRIVKNGSVIITDRKPVEASSLTNYMPNAVFGSVELSVGDTLAVAFTHTYGSTINIFSDPQYTNMQISRFPTSSELVVTPERQNVFGGARWSGNIDSSLTASTAEATLNTTNFGSPAAFGKAQVTSLTDCGLVANDIGFCLKNVPPGTYQFSANLQLGAVGPAGTPGQAVCNAFGVVSGTSLSATKVSQAFSTNGNTTTSEDWTNLPTGLITISSFQSNLAVYITRNKNSSNGACLIRSASVSSANSSLPALQLIPVDQPSNSALYVEGPVKASATGAAIPSGYQGEIVYENFTVTTTSGHQNAGSFSFPPGVYRVMFRTQIYDGNAGSTAVVDSALCVWTTTNACAGSANGKETLNSTLVMNSGSFGQFRMPSTLDFIVRSNGSTLTMFGSTFGTGNTLFFNEFYSQNISVGGRYRYIYIQRIN